MSTPKTTVRLAAMADVHYTKKSQGALYQVFTRVSENADIFLLCGDITNSGQPEEAHVLGKDLKAAVRIPIVAVLGNH
ncbi:MAG TPA: metallophosphoesterase family protein, partial [Dissulfurispiraceae bacterium]